MQRKPAPNTRMAWAIRLNLPTDPDALAGVFFFARGPLDDFHDGVPLAVFRTRAEARYRCKKMWTADGDRRPCVVRVRVTVQEVGR